MKGVSKDSDTSSSNFPGLLDQGLEKQQTVANKMYRKLEHQSTLQSQTATENEYQINLLTPPSPTSIPLNSRRSHTQTTHQHTKVVNLNAVNHTPQPTLQRPRTAMEGTQSAVQLRRTNGAQGNSLLVPNMTERKLDASRVINETRIKLRDYLFMANTSSNLAASSKRETLQYTKRSSEQSEPSKPNYKSPPSTPHTSSLSAPQSPVLQKSRIKQQYNKQKYRISNFEMAAVLRKEIGQELDILRGSIQFIQAGLQTRENISSEQLLELYTLRGNLQRYNSEFAQSTARLSWANTPSAFKKIKDMKNSEIFELAEI